MYPHNGKVMTKPKTLPIKLLDINEFLSSKGTHRAIMACKAGKVTPSNIPWKTLRTIKAQTFHLATTGLKRKNINISIMSARYYEPRLVYLLPPIFHCGLYCRAVSITGNPSMFGQETCVFYIGHSEILNY